MYNRKEEQEQLRINKEFGDFVSDDIQPVSGSIEPASSSPTIRREGTVSYKENRAALLRLQKKERTEQKMNDFNEFY